MHRRPEPTEYDPRYARYIDLVPEADLAAAMLRQARETRRFLSTIPNDLYDHQYALNKWTVREVCGHILDTERIFGFRLLSLARGDTAAFRRADEVSYVKHADFNSYSLVELADEFTLVRRSHVMLLQHLPECAWENMGAVAKCCAFCASNRLSHGGARTASSRNSSDKILGAAEQITG